MELRTDDCMGAANWTQTADTVDKYSLWDEVEPALGPQEGNSNKEISIIIYKYSGIYVVTTAISVRGHLMLVPRKVHTLGASVPTREAFHWKPSQKHASHFPHCDAS